MKKEECYNYDQIVIGFNYVNNDIIISRCCINKNQIYKIFKYEELPSLDIIKELKNIVESGTEPIQRNICYECKSDRCEFPSNKWEEINGIQLSVFSGCNAKCNFCHNPKAYKGNQLVVEKNVYMKTLYELKGKGFKKLTLTDCGEPLLLVKEMKDFFKSLKPGDFDVVFFNTNGILIDDEFIEIFKNCPVEICINVSLNAPNRELYKEIMGVDAFDKVVKNIDKLYDFLYSVSIVYQSKLFNTLDNIKDVVKRTKVVFRLQNCDPTLFSKEELDYYYSLSKYGEVVQC